MRLLALDLKSRKTSLKTAFPDVISQQERLYSYKQGFTDVIRNQNVANKVAVGYLVARKKVASSG